MDVVYTFQSGQAPVPGALRRQPSVVSQHNDATAAKTLSSPTHVGLSPSSSLTNSSGAPPPPAAASSSTAGSELVMKGQHAPCIIKLELFSVLDVHERLKAACVTSSASVFSRCLHLLILALTSFKNIPAIYIRPETIRTLDKEKGLSECRR